MEIEIVGESETIMRVKFSFCFGNQDTILQVEVKLSGT